ncbi:TolC family protein [Stieleria varia]|uniref:Outer membrane efflux protein n=1 Tax=Stieleria varia TaxID=2528005 RepID=A0A5C6ASC3_9BACT|nr:TolC family protein [Stieleria varia]TWU02428.1 Outer membrane efflux protein [Stieleria varia]
MIAFGVAWTAAAICQAQSPTDTGPFRGKEQEKTFKQFLAAWSDDGLDGADDDSDVELNGVDGSERTSGDRSDQQALDSRTMLPDLLANDPLSDLIDGDAVAEEIREGLTLADVIASTYRGYPEIAAARQQPRIASGELLSARGAYDTKFDAFSLSEPTGFYRNYRNGLGLARQTWWGGYVAAGYRIGRGFYQPWYKERQTDDAGEFKVKLTQPLLQGRAIDAERVAVFRASLSQQMAIPTIQQSILDASREAASAYWQWVAAGAILRAQRELLDLAEKRAKQFEIGVKADKFPEVNLIFNEQLIAERRAKLFETEQKFRATGFKLSLYLRNEIGQSLVPDDQWLPTSFPLITPLELQDLQEALLSSLARRPEPQLIRLQIRQTQLDQQLACNEMLPRLDFVMEASQDMGEPATKSDDKGEFELLLGFTSEVPIQRSKARGKVRSTSGKINELSEKLRLARDKISIELQTARNALEQSALIVEQTEASLKASLDVLQRYRFAFRQGKIDLIYLNLLETKVNETEIKLVEAQRDYFDALVQMQVALGLDPLDQAMVISSLPVSDMPSPSTIDLSEEVNAAENESDKRRDVNDAEADNADNVGTED